ncbi:MAG: polysaccharide biosynthesis protein [Clostridiales bacterium]|nr:polysaccharide biosynthesis protein [Clostridiales bacterium]
MVFPKAKLARPLRTALWILLDAVLCNTAMILAQNFRFEMVVPAVFFQRYENLSLIMTAFCVLSLYLFGLYRNIWKFASVSSVLPILLGTLTGCLATYGYSLLNYAVTKPMNYTLLPRTVYMMHWLIFTAFVITSRYLYRIIKTYFVRQGAKGAVRRLMIVGAGWAGSNVIRDVKNGRYQNGQAVIVVDDNPDLAGSHLNGVKILMDTVSIPKYAADYAIDDIIIAIATPLGNMRNLIEICLSTGCRVRRVTSLEDVNRKNTQSDVRDLNISDLLGRSETDLNMTLTAAYFAGKTVLITGGGGSIGSELCRQVLTFQPKIVVLLDINENYLYNLYADLLSMYGSTLKDILKLRIGSVQDEARLDEIMKEHDFDVLLHAAAHKHVPLMEESPEEAVKNNVFGTHLTASCAIRHGIKRFVLISTDKAVNPTNVMGASKRAAEMVVSALGDTSKTDFVSVRFGNVLGSHGSVVPLFERQIRAGGPVTVTHPDIVRYFMTIPEAASLVLQAAVLAKGGELFVLDMGQPIRIRELAERMIQLYTAQGGASRVEIVYTGLRPGDKLYEELLTDDEHIQKTELDKIYVTQSDCITQAEMQEMLFKLKKCMESHGDMRACLRSFIPSFRIADEVNGRLKGVKA